MFEYLAGYRNVLVTGAHRSGTTIAARMIAEDTAKRFEIERNLARPRFPGDDEPELTAAMVAEWLDAEADTVLQGATAFRWLPHIDRDDMAVVFVVRDEPDVIRSQHRYRGRQLDSPRSKLRQFRGYNLANPFEIEYGDLAAHPLFEHDRSGWAPRQIAAGGHDLRR